VDYAKLIYNFSTAHNTVYPQTYELGRYWRNPVTDSVYGMLGILKSRYSIGDYVSSIRQPGIVNALFKKGDMMPGWVYLFQLLSFIRNR